MVERGPRKRSGVRILSLHERLLDVLLEGIVVSLDHLVTCVSESVKTCAERLVLIARRSFAIRYLPLCVISLVPLRVISLVGGLRKRKAWTVTILGLTAQSLDPRFAQ